MNRFLGRGLLGLALLTAACNFAPMPSADTGGGSAGGVISGGPGRGETGRVTNVIDGDTIDVEIDGAEYRIRYVGVNTPERDEPCYSEARAANAAMVQGQTVTLERDVSETDRYGRLLRFVYVGTTFVNATLVSQGWAESVEYQPDTRMTSTFQAYERAAASANLGCHPTGIFNDGNPVR
jgi:endonuclease YncB( thermonuclease family)